MKLIGRGKEIETNINHKTSAPIEYKKTDAKQPTRRDPC